MNDENTKKTSSGNGLAASPCYADKFNNWHWLWMTPLCFFCSPLGLLFWKFVKPDLWWISALGMVIALCGCAANAIEDDGLI